MTRPTFSPRPALMVLLCLAVILAGCNFATKSSEPIYVTATPPGADTLLIPPSPTPLPTPTAVPDVTVRAAERLFLNGDYEGAVGTFQTVLDEPAESVAADVRIIAAYGLGEAALRDGRFAEAVNALTMFLAQYPNDSRASWTYYLRGDALMGLGQWAAAIADFEQYLARRPGVIDSYVHEQIGDAYFAQGMVAEATQRYEQAIQAGRGLVPLLALREKVAQVYLNIGQPTAALAQYDAILAVARNAPYRAEIAFLAAQALQASGDDPGAYTRYQQVMASYTETPYAYQALRLLLAAEQPVEAELRARVAYAAEDYQDAIAALHTYTSELALNAIPPEIHLMLGRAYRAVGSSSAAWTSFQTIIDLAPNSPEFGVALLEQGRTRFLDGDTAGAVERYMFLVDTYPQLPEAPEALWRVGYLYSTQDREQDAVSVFERLGLAYPGNEWAMDGLLRAAMIALKRNDMATAERVLAALGATGTGEKAAAAYLWLGKLALQHGSISQAESALRSAAAADPGGYFSIRAEDLLLGRGFFEPPASYRFEFDNQLELGQVEDWLRTTFGITQMEALWPLSAQLAADPRAIAGRELWALLAVDEASEEFYSLLDDYADDPLASYQLAIWLRGFGAYPHSIVGAANIIKQANIPTLSAPAYLARMRYPVFYSDLIIPEAQARGLDPLMLFALIRQESLFDRYATAAAGEKGLTQVIPDTASYIAGQLNWSDFQPEDLFRPYVSVAFGAYYLWEQLNRFDFNPVVGLAAYNAGPGNAANWLAESGSDPDLFVEAIGFSGTQTYVRRIYEHYSIYRQLYGAG